MNKLLITEINRIQELMGKPLITEITIPKKLIEELIGKFGPKMSKTVNDLITSLKNANDNDVIANIIAKLANEDESLSKLITPKVIANLPIESRNNIEAVKDYFDELLKKRVPVSDEEKRRTIDAFMKNNVKTELKGVNDIIRKELTDYVDDLFPSKPAKEVTNLTDEIPESAISTTPSGKNRAEIFDVKTWTNKTIKVDDEIIAGLANNKMWDKVKREFESLFTITKPRIEYIKKLAKAIETTTNSEYKSKLIPMLKKELEWVYKKQSNTFVSLRQYFDDVADIDRSWGKTWSKIKTETNNGWDFYNVFGKLSRMSWLDRVWEILLNDIKVNFETELNLFSKLPYIKPMEVKDFKGSLISNIISGSRSGFPKMTNKAYEDVIKKYGLTGARTRYFRDLIIQSLRWNLYIGFLVTTRNTLANSFYENDITECANSKNINSKSCKKITETKFGRKMAEWALAYRNDPNSSSNFMNQWLVDELFSVKSNWPQFAEKDDEWRVFSKLSVLDPGSVGELFKGFHDLVRFNDDPSSVDNVVKYLNEQIDFAKNESEDVRRRLNDEVKKVVDDEVVNDIDEDDFRRWCQTNGKVFVRYDDGIGTTFEEGKEKYWYFDTDTNTFEENKPE
jgi:hypothetical protein